jgi:hypothetical protein
VSGQRGDVAAGATMADEGLAEVGSADRNVGDDPDDDGVAGLLLGCLRHAVHDGRPCPDALSRNGFPLMLPDAVLPVPAPLMMLLVVFGRVLQRRSARSRCWPAVSSPSPGSGRCAAC